MTDKKIAKNTKAVLIRGSEDYFIRVYDPKNKRKFIDYDIRHNDLEIIIIDEDAVFIDEATDYGYIDYSDETLGNE